MTYRLKLKSSIVGPSRNIDTGPKAIIAATIAHALAKHLNGRVVIWGIRGAGTLPVPLVQVDEVSVKSHGVSEINTKLIEASQGWG